MNWLRVILGVICGVVATGPMTVAMVGWHRRLPRREKYPLPPTEITEAVLERMGVAASGPETSVAAMVAHFGYGGAVGGLYALDRRAAERDPVRSGVLLGILVWSLSYFGFLPMLGLMRSASEHPARRNRLMLGAHLIWGTCLCGLYRLFTQDAQSERPALRSRGEPARDAIEGAEKA